MIDLHSHILPGQDDGAQSLEESLEMARMAVDSGITVMVATPHCRRDRTREIYAAWKLLREALEESGIPLQVLPGMEIYGTRETAGMLREGRLFTLGGSRYPLIEFSFQSDGEEESWILQSVRQAGYRPVVAHPERYSYVQDNLHLINDWYRMGCLFQVNRGSLMGRFGPEAQEAALELVQRGFATVVASDAHSPRIRTPWMADVWDMLAEEVAPICARTLLYDNPKRILKNEKLPPVQPEWFE